jgi:hypothetical protein
MEEGGREGGMKEGKEGGKEGGREGGMRGGEWVAALPFRWTWRQLDATQTRRIAREQSVSSACVRCQHLCLCPSKASKVSTDEECTAEEEETADSSASEEEEEEGLEDKLLLLPPSLSDFFSRLTFVSFPFFLFFWSLRRALLEDLACLRISFSRSFSFL